MNTQRNYQLGLLYLVHLLIGVDGVVDENESKALQKVRDKENINEDIFSEFEKDVSTKKERDIYQKGIELISQCSEAEKLNAFVHLYKMSEADGRVHVKEVRLLLYSIKMAGVEFDDVILEASKVKNY